VPTMTLQELFGVELPIIQAPMAGSQKSELAIAVSNAGGLGSLPCGMLSPNEIRAELSAIRAQTDRPYNVNFYTHPLPEKDPRREAAWRALPSPYFKEYGMVLDDNPAAASRTPFSPAAADLLEDFRPSIMSFHFGLPAPDLLTRVKGWGAKVMACATTVDEARWLEKNGADAIVAQGLEAGGHRGMFLSKDLTTQAGTLALVPQIVSAVRVPVIAAGGIADAQGVAAVVALGAAGAQIGTAYLLCPEASTSAVHRAALKSPRAAHTALTNLFSGRPVRAIMNRLMTELGLIHPAAPSFPLASIAIAELRSRAEPLGVDDFSPMSCGQNASGCREIPAAALTRALLNSRNR
jgi:nitronate monooxygenase